ncbi:hypothetical protein IAU59_007107 [Kwoniella sp. CBS 9459]
MSRKRGGKRGLSRAKKQRARQRRISARARAQRKMHLAEQKRLAEQRPELRASDEYYLQWRRDNPLAHNSLLPSPEEIEALNNGQQTVTSRELRIDQEIQRILFLADSMSRKDVRAAILGAADLCCDVLVLPTPENNSLDLKFFAYLTYIVSICAWELGDDEEALMLAVEACEYVDMMKADGWNFTVEPWLSLEHLCSKAHARAMASCQTQSEDGEYEEDEEASRSATEDAVQDSKYEGGEDSTPVEE